MHTSGSGLPPLLRYRQASPVRACSCICLFLYLLSKDLGLIARTIIDRFIRVSGFGAALWRLAVVAAMLSDVDVVGITSTMGRSLQVVLSVIR